MYKHCDLDDSCISLHDCCAEKINFDNGILSFIFPDGFWITQYHSLNDSDNTVLTNSSQVDFEIFDKKGIEIFIFNKTKKGTVIRNDWELINFRDMVNAGNFRIEFLTQYKSHESLNIIAFKQQKDTLLIGPSSLYPCCMAQCRYTVGIHKNNWMVNS